MGPGRHIGPLTLIRRLQLLLEIEFVCLCGIAKLLLVVEWETRVKLTLKQVGLADLFEDTDVSLVELARELVNLGVVFFHHLEKIGFNRRERHFIAQLLNLRQQTLHVVVLFNQLTVLLVFVKLE